MADSEIERLISFSRCSSYAAFLPVILYLPIGLVLGLTRLCIFLHACLLSYILPKGFPFKRLILRIMLSVTGLPISVQGVLSTDAKKKILVANHVSSLDPFVLALFHPNILVIESSGWPKNQLRPCKTFEVPSDKNRDDILTSLKEKIQGSEEALLFFPERLKTNGKSLLRFSQLPFEVDCSIQPVTIQVYRFLFDISMSTYSSSTYEDLMWCLVLPLTLFKIKYLPVTEKKKDETREEFANRFQSNMARSLGVTTSVLTYHDVTKYIKRKTVAKARGLPLKHRGKLEDLPPPEPSLYAEGKMPVVDLELEKMAKQVKDVLPDTPTELILSDLKKSRDVDVTITNILEGKADHTKPNQEVKMHSSSISEGLSFKAEKFEVSASARQLSFIERKQVMLEAARLKYRLKHGI